MYGDMACTVVICMSHDDMTCIDLSEVAEIGVIESENVSVNYYTECISLG